jgi:hypothetical protein
MYPIERAMKVFKGYVRNRSRLEASMAEGYILDETIGFVNKISAMFDIESGMQMKRRGFMVKLWKELPQS